RALEALESLYDKESGSHLAELAHHAALGQDLERGPLYARRAAEYALAQLAYEEAARLCQAALEALEHSSSPPADVLAELLIKLGDAQGRAGDGPASRATFVRAADIARASGLTDALGRAALGYGGADLWGPRAEAEPELVALLEEALAACPPGDGTLRVQL